MPHRLATVTFPHARVLLARTKLAYVHLRNLLTDAKRDRMARVFGYVAIWMPEEMILLYLQEGELVNATSHDGMTTMVLPIAAALERVPSGPEYGEICFHEADDEQLACMFATHAWEPEPWPPELDPRDLTAVVSYLMATTYDGMLEIEADGRVGYVVLRNGAPTRAFVGGDGPTEPAPDLMSLLAPGGRAAARVRRWPVPPPLPVQAPPGLIQAYRELTWALVASLEAAGKEGAGPLAEHARRALVGAHPVLDGFRIGEGMVHDPVADTETLTAGVAAWVTGILWACGDLQGTSPEVLLRDLTRDRRHMLQSAGFFERLPWTVQ
ncbi:MAG TPA: hypothetical protein VNA89_02845 [Gemmatimonadaceae bacterium]|nr:hypothetical protein [Gemmatimonadaceae bacterium]